MDGLRRLALPRSYPTERSGWSAEFFGISSDASYKDQDGGRASDLVGHLTTDDFFGIDSFPTAPFEIVTATTDKVTGKLTVKGVTVDEELEITNMTVSESGVSFTGTF